MAAPKPYRPRDDRVPSDLRDLLDRHMCRATESDAALRRYCQLIRDLCLAAVVVAFCGAAIAIGLTLVLRSASAPPWLAGALGLVSTATAAVGLRRRALRRRRPVTRLPNPGHEA
jgi:hypothetical protein